MNANRTNAAVQTATRTMDATATFLAERAAVIQLGAIQQRRNDEIDEKNARRIVRLVTICRVAVPATLIALVLASAYLPPSNAPAGALLEAGQPVPGARGFTSEYFPDQYVNQAQRVADQSPTF